MRTPAAGKPEDLLQLYLGHLDAKRSSPATRALSEQALGRFFFHLRESRVRDLREVRIAHVVAFTRTLQRARSKSGEPLSAHTQAAFLSRVRAFFAFLEARGILLVSPARDLSIPAVKRLPRCPVSPGLAAKLMNEPSPWSVLGRRDRAMLELLYGTGLRVMECSGLDLMDVDLQEHTLLVRDGKGRKDRMVPIPASALRALETYLAESRARLARGHESALFVSRYGGRATAATIRARVSQHADGARLKARVSPHALRHAYATHLLQGGADVRHVQELLGHKRIETTALYTRVDVSDLRAMLIRSHPREQQGRR